MTMVRIIRLLLVVGCVGAFAGVLLISLVVNLVGLFPVAARADRRA